MLHCTVAEAMDRLSVTEFFEWQVFFRLESRMMEIAQERAERKARRDARRS